jgi:hypothetical protein
MRQTALVLLTGLCLSVTSAFAIDFYGADVTDSDLPSSYLKIGLLGFRPVVASVTLDSPAAKHGFQRGDIIVSINGKDIKSSSELHRFTTDVLSVSIFRNREKMTLTIDRHAIGNAETRQSSVEKQSALQRQVTRGVPVAVGNSTPVTPKERAVASRSPVTQTQNMPPRQVLPEKADIFKRPIKPSQDRIIFANKKGEVTFSHSIHLKSLSKEECLLCHRTENPTHESIQSRLDNHRAAHGFCRGCHQKIETAPTTECQVCHNYNKKE